MHSKPQFQPYLLPPPASIVDLSPIARFQPQPFSKPPTNIPKVPSPSSNGKLDVKNLLWTQTVYRLQLQKFKTYLSVSQFSFKFTLRNLPYSGTLCFSNMLIENLGFNHLCYLLQLFNIDL